MNRRIELKPPEGMKYNEDEEIVDRVLDALVNTKGNCPCRPKHVWSKDTICPCKDAREKNECICKIFIKDSE